MRYAGLIKNDILNSDDGICVSLWTQGCPHHCVGCHNPETWDFSGGKEISVGDLVEEIGSSIRKDGIERNFSILGGEPLCDENLKDIEYIVLNIRKAFPDIKIYIWTGYEYKNLKRDKKYKDLLLMIDKLIDGRFDIKLKDLTLPLRGSSNQSVISLKKRVV